MRVGLGLGGTGRREMERSLQCQGGGVEEGRGVEEEGGGERGGVTQGGGALDGGGFCFDMTRNTLLKLKIKNSALLCSLLVINAITCMCISVLCV